MLHDIQDQQKEDTKDGFTNEISGSNEVNDNDYDLENYQDANSEDIHSSFFSGRRNWLAKTHCKTYYKQEAQLRTVLSFCQALCSKTYKFANFRTIYDVPFVFSLIRRQSSLSLIWCLIINITMQKYTSSRVKGDPSRSIKGEVIHPLPFLDQRKQSLPFEDQLRYTHKQSPPLIQQNLTETPFLSQKSSKQELPFSIPKELATASRKMPMSPKKIALREKLYQTLEGDIIRKQIEDGRIQAKEGLYKDKSALSSVMKNAEKQEFSKRFKLINDKPSNRAFLYQPYKKRSAANQRDKLKPITSEAHISTNEVYFFNVEKIILAEGERHKKSNSLIVNGFGEKDQKMFYQKHEKQVPNSKLIKEINIIKEKLNISKVIAMNEESQYKQGKNLPDIINIRSFEQKGQEKVEIKAEQFCEKTSDNQETPQAMSLVVSPMRQTIKKGESLCSKSKNNSPVRRNRRKFIIPFETYYYRDLLWKVNFTNNLYVETPLQYEHRLKVYVGRGNNSCMVSGLISRRPWYAFTDRVQEANFVWTQLKQLNFYKKQEPFTSEIPLQQRDKAKYQPQLILTSHDSQQIATYFNTYFTSEQHADQRLVPRIKSFKYRLSIKAQDIKQQRLHNHLINNYVIGNKKALFNTMSNYYKEVGLEVFDFLPLTFHIKDGMEDKKYFQFLKYYHKRAKEIARNNQDKTKVKEYNAWIVKPGQNSNRGNGIAMCLTLQQVKAALKKRDRYPDGSFRTHIVQAYIERPLLYFKRKFDLRHYIMISSINGLVKGYWYKDGYVRTTSSEYSLNFSDGSIHLTNDAVQKNLPDYGKYEKGNKISYDELAAYIEKYHKKKAGGFYQTIYPRMKRMATDAIRACSGGIDPAKMQNNFEVFGMDFMIDANLDVWLIEINTNPCLELSCPLLSSLIPKMVENALELTMDAIFPPPVRYCPKGIHYFKQLQKQNRFELVYDERVERLYSGSLQVLDNKLLQEEDDTFEDCGDEWEDS